MFRFWFYVNFSNAVGESENDDFEVVIDTDNLFDARAQLVYQLSRNPKVFAPFVYDFQYMEQFVNGKWKAVGK